ncbi:hypothetical protein D3C84_1228550 [compost metagenome]
MAKKNISCANRQLFIAEAWQRCCVAIDLREQHIYQKVQVSFSMSHWRQSQDANGDAVKDIFPEATGSYFFR